MLVVSICSIICKSVYLSLAFRNHWHNWIHFCPNKKWPEWVQEQIIRNVRESWHNVVPYVHIILERVITPRGTRYCWAWYKQSFETNKLTMFLETESAYPYCNWSIKMVRIIWLGPTSVDIGPAYVNNFKRLGRFPFWVYVKFGNSLKQKSIL